MEVRRFARGDILFREGDAVDRVFHLRAGEVEILRGADGQTIVMGVVGPGQFLGEMGVVEERAGRSATARAAGEVEAEQLTPAEFFERLDRTPGLARDLVRRLSQRLRIADTRVFDDETRPLPMLPAPAAPVPSSSHLSSGDAGPGETALISGETPWLRRQLPEPLRIAHFPFVVGRRPSRGEEGPRRAPDLLLDDTRPYRLSRDHFMILARDGTLYLRDLFSTLGTLVNGVAIGEHFGKDEVPLQPGANTVVAGGRESRFAFTVRVS